MSIKPDKTYHGTVASGSQIIQSQSGNMGFQIFLDCEDGATEFVVWMTDKNRERAKTVFVDALGVPEDKLQDSTYFQYMLAEDIVGREVTFKTVEEEYKGFKKVKVAFLFKRSSLAGKTAGKAAAQFFGAPVDDSDDIPF